MKHSLKNVLKSGWTNFKRNSYLSIAVTGVMSLVLLLLLGLISFQFLTSRLVTSIEDKLDVSAYFQTTTAEEQILSIKTDLEKLPEVTEVVYLSREKVLEDFRAEHADEPETLEALEQLDGNPFGATLNIRAKDPQNYGAVTTFLKNSSYRSEMATISDNKEVIEKINSITGALRTWGFVVAVAIAIIAILITFNTIRLTIYNQKQEIEIMRLVGASNWYIRGPFLAEGAFYGLFSALVSLILFYPILYAISPKLSLLVPGINVFHYFVINSWQIALIILAAGIIIGMLSSVIAIRRHLKI